MFNFKKLAIAAAILTIGASAATSSFAREDKAPRGHDPRLSSTTGDVVAREKGEVRGEGAGHPVSGAAGEIVAREKGEVRGEGAGHPAIDSQGNVVA